MKKHFHIHIGGIHKDILHKGKLAGIFSRVSRDPYVDWAITLIGSIIVALALVGFGLMLFLSINSGGVAVVLDNSSSISTSTSVSLKTIDLERLIALFGAKNNTTALFTKGYTGPSDPSTVLTFVAPHATSTPQNK